MFAVLHLTPTPPIYPPSATAAVYQQAAVAAEASVASTIWLDPPILFQAHQNQVKIKKIIISIKTRFLIFFSSEATL